MFNNNCIHANQIAAFVLHLIFCGALVKAVENKESIETVNLSEETGQDGAANSEDSWVESLMWNLLGYATIIVPSALVIRVLKNSNFNKKSGK